MGLFGDLIGAVASRQNNITSNAASILNAQNSFNNSSSNSWGMSNSNGFEDSSYYNMAQNNSWSRVFGSDASAADISRAEEANRAQAEFMAAQMAYNSAEAQKARDFQAYMSNTAYQRAVSDLLKAGLNPILAAGNMGASTPQGAFATSGLQTAYKANTYADSESGGSGYSSGGGSSHGENTSHSKNTSNSSSHGETNTQLNSIRQAALGFGMGLMDKVFNSDNSGRSTSK